MSLSYQSPTNDHIFRRRRQARICSLATTMSIIRVLALWFTPDVSRSWQAL